MATDLQGDIRDIANVLEDARRRYSDRRYSGNAGHDESIRLDNELAIVRRAIAGLDRIREVVRQMPSESVDDDYFTPPTQCECSVTHPPCSWCERSKEDDDDDGR